MHESRVHWSREKYYLQRRSRPDRTGSRACARGKKDAQRGFPRMAQGIHRRPRPRQAISRVDEGAKSHPRRSEVYSRGAELARLMPERFFLDTNIFAYTFDVRDAKKRRSAQELVSRALSSGEGVISYQVVQECLHFLLRKLVRPMTEAEAQSYLAEILMPLCRVFPSGALYSDAVSLSARNGWTFYDSLIVSAAVAAGCDVL